MTITAPPKGFSLSPAWWRSGAIPMEAKDLQLVLEELGVAGQDKPKQLAALRQAVPKIRQAGSLVPDRFWEEVRAFGVEI